MTYQHRRCAKAARHAILVLLLLACIPAVQAVETDSTIEAPETDMPEAASTAAPPAQLPDIEVTAEAEPFAAFVIHGDQINPAGPGAGDVLSWAPGADVNTNGVLTPIAQYRGLFGNRLNVTVDGVITHSACPNEMEPPLHYLSLPRFQALEMERGIASVSSGLETMGTSIEATTRAVEYGEQDRFRFTGEVSAYFRSVDEGHSVGGLVGASNDRHRVQVGFSEDRGDDYAYGGGTVATSRYDRWAAEVGYGFRTDRQEFEAAWLRNETGDTGTPSLPMDIRYVDSDAVRLSHTRQFDGSRFRWRFSHATVDHLMDNYGLRPVMNPAMRRYSLAESGSTAYGLAFTVPAAGGELELGTDGHLADNDADILSPDNAAFFVRNFNDARRDRFGVYAEWTGPFAAGWQGELGARYRQVRMDADAVDASPAGRPGGVRVLRDRFNAADRSRRDDDYDLVALARRRLGEHALLEFGLARKTRSPSHQERYLWLPLESTAGLADGKRYVGDIGLSPEVSHQAELGLNWRAEAFEFSPRIFYRRVDDFIQGVPSTDPVVIAVSTASGDPTPLVFANVDAVLWGMDMPWRIGLGNGWRLDGVVSYVRGKRRDIDDDLFRIAPLNGRIGAAGMCACSWI
ncbi:MAG: TonB-dependent receptor [Gammaproteobacteria bacterium]